MKHVLTAAGTTGGIIAGIIAGLSAIAVAGCTDSSVLYRPVAFGQQPVIAAWNSGFSGKTALIEVHNAPADAAAQLAERASVPVGAAPVAGFTSVPAQASDPRYRVVLVFGTSDAFDGAAACALAGPGMALCLPASRTRPVTRCRLRCALMPSDCPKSACVRGLLRWEAGMNWLTGGCWGRSWTTCIPPRSEAVCVAMDAP